MKLDYNRNIAIIVDNKCIYKGTAQGFIGKVNGNIKDMWISYVDEALFHSGMEFGQIRIVTNYQSAVLA